MENKGMRFSLPLKMKAIYSKQKYILFAAVSCIFLALVYFNALYLTGYGYAELCWEATQIKSPETSKDFKDVMAKAKFNDRAKQCELIANKAMFGRGYVTAGNPDYAVTPELKEIQKYCPNSFNQLPIFGLHYWVVAQLENGDNLTIFDRLLPARFFIERMIDKKWGQCPEVRAKVGVPRLVEQPDGTWAFESECIPCKAELKAAEDERNRVSRPVHELWNFK
jgi:hypothetical protein